MKKRFALLAALVFILSAVPAALSEEPPPEMRVVGFEIGTTMGFEGRGEVETLAVTNDEAYSGSRSLLVTGRSAPWHGPALDVTFFVRPGATYVVSVWVKAKSPDSSLFRLSTQVGRDEGASYFNLDRKTVSRGDGWVQLTGRHIYPESDFVTIYVENDTPDAEFYIDELTFFSLSGGGWLASIQLPSLRERYADYFLIGSAFSNPDLSGQRFELVQRHFNALTAGNAMKPNALGGRERGAYTLESADRMVGAILEAGGIDIIGHTLVWHSQSADWLNMNPDGSPLTRAEAKENMEEYINTVAGHFAGRVIAWDVVNEAFNDGVGNLPFGWRSGLRANAPWFTAYSNGADEAAGEHGSDYIYDAFVFARLADPSATLYYNDFNEEARGKREAIAQMTEEFNERWLGDARNIEPDRLLIEGLGMQAHYWTDNLNPQDVEATIVRWIETGAEVSVTELDIPAGRWNGFKTLDEAEERKQARLYAELFQIYMKYSEHIARVSIWGIDDPTSWRSQGSPLLFDENGGAKFAFYAVLDPEGYLAGDYDDIKNNPAGGDSTAVPATPPPDPSPSPVPSGPAENGDEPGGTDGGADGGGRPGAFIARGGAPGAA
ncbi:MAG: endo-1,4-beta-xylanase, partial [Oscillospiraceae bacterium]|nr:endo-1,4-beta-xylanase [Oscillospiraceae bacterium]